MKKGFVVTDKAAPDFELLGLKFHRDAPDPKFKPFLAKNGEKYADGLTVLRSAQCPYSEKNVAAIMETAKKKFGLNARLVDLEGAAEVQGSPCAFGTFCIVYNGEVISHHPISNTRFENIMKKMKK
jgi:hypothetical protein